MTRAIKSGTESTETSQPEREPREVDMLAVEEELSERASASATPAELGRVGVRQASTPDNGRVDAAAARWACATRANSATLLSIGGFCMGTTKGSMFAVRRASARETWHDGHVRTWASTAEDSSTSRAPSA